MALSNAILVLLSEKPMSGYDLAKAFDASIGFFWRADHQQIYRELGRLRDGGLVQAEEVVQSGRPNKLVYTPTLAGLWALKAWSQEPTTVPPVRDELLVRFYALDHVDLPALRKQVEARLAQYRSRLSRYEEILARHFSLPDMTLVQIGRYLGLRRGLGHDQALVAWCEEALRLLPMGAAAMRVDVEAAPRDARLH